MTNVPLLETRNLNMRFGGVHATRDVNFKLSDGELRCIIGPNGAGKSTFFKQLTGQLRPTSGQVLFRGQDITGCQPHVPARLGIGIKTQVPSLFNGLSVWENVWLSACRVYPKAKALEVTRDTLERVGLSSLQKSTTGLLAHGQRQWVELAVVIAADPSLILLDEPAAGMSDQEVRRTADLILEINKSHALIVVEHDMSFIRMIAKMVTVFHKALSSQKTCPTRS